MGILREDYAEQFTEPRRSWLVPVAVVVAIALAAAAWWVFVSRRDDIPMREFVSPELGCRFSHPSRLFAGPNFVRSRTGAFLTIERHSLFEAEKEFVRTLPDSLYPQVKIQLDQTFRELEEVSQGHGTLGGRPAFQIELDGKPGVSNATTKIIVDIAATKDWVYVLRTTIPNGDVEADRSAFDAVRRTFVFLDDAPASPGE